MRKLNILLVLFILIFSLASAQEDIQSFQAKISELKGKSIETLNMDDVKYLESVVSMSSQRYGASFQKVVDAQKSIAKGVLAKYDTWLKEKNKAENLDAELGTERIKTAAQEQVIIAQGDTILEQKAVIEKLRAEINRLKKEKNRAVRTNKKLKDEKTNLENLMNDNMKLVGNINNLMTDDFGKAEGVPLSMRDELSQTECEVAELVKENYLLTIGKLKQDKEYLDNLRQYFKENNRYPDEFYEYIDRGEFLVLKFQDSQSPCVNTKALEIKSSVDELKMLIENKECDFFCKIAEFFSGNILILGLVILIIVGIVILLVIRRK